ncbi:hypothetical protein OIU84_016337 [Salix udensis]|uniref:Uncharacterized protein n=1 Tax=Salix udensis TaxID=889485 RepID=A0AAD6J9P5_9ROSI|nr:hypothetical protein OIU84_016337 [Salix udensis]
MPMAFSVIRSSRGLIRPLEQTPSGILDLSVIDRLPVLRCNARTLHVFRHGPEAAQVIREALSKALVPYYPLAGWLKESSQGQLQIECSAQGVLFVEASADCTLDTMQVTQFECGGFVIGLIFCHTICDGLGAAQFLNAVGEIARGHEHPSTTPVWCRDFSPLPPQQEKMNTLPLLPPPMPNYRLQHANIDISLDQIKQVKTEFHDSTGQMCSTFEALLEPPLPKGFYGNCFFPVTITASSETVARASNVEVIKLIQEAKEWGRLGFNQVDYGWGPPVHIVPIQGSSVIPVGIVGSLPLPGKGIRLMTWCVEEVHRQPFIDQMMKVI